MFEWVIGTSVGILGLCSGSFVNMMEYRVAKLYGILGFGKKFVNKDRSCCDFCGEQLHIYENIPVISWLIQKGKTRCCRKKLPLSYPIVEIMTAVLFLINFFVFANKLDFMEWGLWTTWVKLFLQMVIVTMMMFLMTFDFKYMILPDIGIIVSIVAGIGLMLLNGVNYLNIMWSTIGASGFLGALCLFTKGKGMGMGDVKFAVVMGILLGFPKIIWGMYTGFILGAIYGIILITMKKANRKSEIAFGPFLIIGLLVWWWM
jgi:prepilin signal peptidase PulO-like enzyme (type II secretory pathway)